MDGSLVIGVLTRLRRLFYAVTPNETSFPTVEEVPKYVDEVSRLLWLYLISDNIEFRLLDASDTVFSK